MRLAFFLQPDTHSAVILSHTRPATAKGACLLLAGATDSLEFSLEDVEEQQKREDFWELVACILRQGRDLVLEYCPYPENSGTESSLESVVRALEQCPCLLPLHIWGSYRTVDALPALTVLFVVQGCRHPEPLPQSDIPEAYLMLGWMFVRPEEKAVPRKINDLSALRDVAPSLESRLDDAAGKRAGSPELRCISLGLGNDWMERIALSLKMIRLDRFHDSSGCTRKISSLTWEKDVFPAVLGHGASFCPPGTWPPILADSILEHGFSAENRDTLFLWDKNAVRDKLRHVILRGAAGTGKSTLGRLLLLHELLRDGVSRVVYMGPTRMLVEESYAAFCSLVQSLPQRDDFDEILLDDIVISTGERTEGDSRIQSGDFRALFIVYEKLNNFFHYTNIVRSVNCVMVDEVQMVCDPERGGILDIIINSLCREANRRFSLDDMNNFLRMIICTTENMELRKRFSIQTDIREKFRAPVILEDSQPFREPSFWFQFRIKQRMHSLPIELAGQHKKNTLITPHPYLPAFPGARKKELVLCWVREWMWGHEKVLYVSSNPSAMMTLAGDLYNERPDIFGDEKSLACLRDALLESELYEQICTQIVTYARRGIFFNFSNMGYAARGISAQMYRDCSCEKGIPVITFATSTIMYGVNLPADLIIVKDLVWPCSYMAGVTDSISSYSNGKNESWFRSRYLKPCEFTNITGRVGRHGICSPSIVPTVVASTFYPRKSQRFKFNQSIERLFSPQEEQSLIFEWRKEPPRKLGDFSPAQQRFFMNSLLHGVAQKKNCSLNELLCFIESTWAWEPVRQECRTEIWKKYLADFFAFLYKEFPECVYVFCQGGTTILQPLSLCYSVCQTGANLATLKELKELLGRWNIQRYPRSAHAVIVLLALVITAEFWELFLDFHVEGKWGDKIDGDSGSPLTDWQQSQLDKTKAQEERMAAELENLLQSFMDDANAKSAIMDMRLLLEEKHVSTASDCISDCLEKRRVLLAFRSALAILAWCCGELPVNINRYRYADCQQPSNLSSVICECSFAQNFRMRFSYTLSSFHVYCAAGNSDGGLAEAVMSAREALLQQKLPPFSA